MRWFPLRGRAASSMVWLVVAAAAATLSLAAQAPGTAGSATLYEGARLIAGDGSAPVENAAFLVENNRFTQVGRKGEIKAPAGAARVDLTGMTVIPALVDLHTHLGYWNYATKTISKENFTRANLVDQLERAAYYGFGAVMSVGDIGDAAFMLRQETIPDAALIRTTGRGLAYPGSGPVGDAAVRNDIPFPVTTEDEARRGVREQAARKPDFIKIWVDDRNGTRTKLSPALYGAIIDEAHRNNLPVVAHIYKVSDAKALMRAGVDGFFHGGKDVAADAEFIGLIKERPRVFLAPGGGAAAGADLTKRNIMALKAAGQPIVLGSDTQPGPQQMVGLRGHMEIANMVAAGLTPAEALIAATSRPAALLKLDQLGTIARGKSADFVVLEANPLDAIANTQRIGKVYLRGREVNRAALRAKWEREGSVTASSN